MFLILKLSRELIQSNNLSMSTHERISPSETLQVLKYDEDRKLVFFAKKLEDVLLKNDIKDREVAVISIAGAYRGGKSFMLNFFLRYLYSRVSVKH